MQLYAQAIPQVEPGAAGIHLMWLGPPSFLYSPGGWRIERRRARGQRGAATDCDDLDGGRLATLRIALEERVGLGTVTLRQGSWPEAPPLPCEVFTFELDEVTAPLSGSIRATQS